MEDTTNVPDNFLGYFDFQKGDRVYKLIVTDYENTHYAMEEIKLETVESSRIMEGETISYQLIKLEGIDTEFSSVDFIPDEDTYATCNVKEHKEFLQTIRNRSKRKATRKKKVEPKVEEPKGGGLKIKGKIKK